MLGRTLLVIVACTLAACAQPVPPASSTAQGAPSPAGIAQRHVCGGLAADVCEAAIAAVIRQVPDAARSRIAVAATWDPAALGDFAVIVAFAPWDQEDYAFNPPTWVASQPLRTSGWQVEPLRGNGLPPQFLALLRQAGVAP